MQRQANGWVRHAALAVASLLAGGTVLGTCEARLHDSAVNGTKSWFLGLFDPANLDDYGLVDLDGQSDATTP